MDIQLVCIFFIFGLLFVLERIDVREKFAVVRPGYTNTSPFLDIRYDPVSFSVNLKDKDREFGNFGTIGSYPTNPLCSSCILDSDTVSAPYIHVNDLGDETGDLLGKVSRKCNVSNSFLGKNYDNLRLPFLVAGRSAGRTRQCRRLL